MYLFIKTANLITKIGYQHLAKLSMNLTSLNVYGTSLVNTKSVESLISLGLQNLEELQIGKTSISQRDLLKILSKITKNKLISFSLRENVFPIQFYIQFSKMEFTSLQKLDLYDLLLGEEIAQVLQRMKFPSLRKLRLQENEFETKDLVKFLKKQNYPCLQSLNVNLNFLDQLFYKHLANQKFILKQLFSKTIQMNKQGLLEVSKIDWSKMQQFHFNFATVTPEILSQFFFNANLSKLKVFDMRSVLNTGNFFKMLLKQNLQTLQQIFIPDVGIIQEKDIKQNIFPNLKKAQFIDFYNTFLIQKLFIQKIHIMAPKLQQLHYVLNNAFDILLEILSSTQQIKVKSPLKLSISQKSRADKQYQNSYKLLEMTILPKQNPHVSFLNEQLFFTAMRSFVYFQEEFDFNKNIDQFLNHFNITYINEIDGSLQLLFIYTHKPNKYCYFPNLTTITINPISQQVEFIRNCSLPSLTSLAIRGLKGYQYLDESEYFQIFDQIFGNSKIQTKTFPNFPYFPYLQSIDFQNSQKKYALGILQKDQYKFLQRLNLANLQLSPEQFKSITERFPYFNRVRQLKLSLNSLNKNFSQISSSYAKLKKIEINDIVLNYQVFQRDACLINYEFITYFDFSTTSIKDSNIINWINCLKNNNQGHLFPKLQQAYFDGNSLGTLGINTFMELDHPLLVQVQFLQNKDPQIFNSIYRHPSSKRLVSFTTINNYFSGIDPSIDPKSTRKIRNIKIQSSNLRSSDIETLSKLSFPSLIKADMSFEKISDCQSLQILRKMCSKISLLYILMQQTNGLNSTCISKKESIKYLTSHIQVMIHGAYSQARNFVEFFFTPGQSITTILLPGVYISDSKLLQIAKTADLENLETLILTFNDLGDIGIREILSRNFTELKYVDIGKNQRVTSASLSKMKNLTFPKLQQFNFSQTSIDDSGIQALTTNSFPSLVAMNLKNTQITKKGLKKLESLNAPNFYQLNLSCNEFTIEDLMEFNITAFQNLRVIFLYPSLTDQQFQLITKKWTQNGQRFLQIITDVRREDVVGLDLQIENY